MNLTRGALIAAIISTAINNTQALAKENNRILSSERYLIDNRLAQAPPVVQVETSGRKGGPKDGPEAGPGDGPKGRLRAGFRGPGGPEPGPVGPPGPPMRRLGPPGPPDFGFVKSLNLSDEQREKLHSIREQEFLASITRHAEIMKLRHQIGEALRGGETDRNAVLQLQAQLNNLQNADEIEKVTSMVESNAVLTVEQRKQMRKHMLEHEPLFGPPGPPGHGHGPGPDRAGVECGPPGPPGHGPGPAGRPPGPMGSMKPAKNSVRTQPTRTAAADGPTGNMLSAIGDKLVDEII